jgi:hypothetical protein
MSTTTAKVDIDSIVEVTGQGLCETVALFVKGHVDRKVFRKAAQAYADEYWGNGDRIPMPTHERWRTVRTPNRGDGIDWVFRRTKESDPFGYDVTVSSLQDWSR